MLGALCWGSIFHLFVINLVSFHLCHASDDKQEENKENNQDKQNENVTATEEEKAESKGDGDNGKDNEKEEKDNKEDKMEVDGEAKQTDKRFVLVSIR